TSAPVPGARGFTGGVGSPAEGLLSAFAVGGVTGAAVSLWTAADGGGSGAASIFAGGGGAGAGIRSAFAIGDWSDVRVFFSPSAAGGRGVPDLPSTFATGGGSGEGTLAFGAGSGAGRSCSVCAVTGAGVSVTVTVLPSARTSNGISPRRSRTTRVVSGSNCPVRTRSNGPVPSRTRGAPPPRTVPAR